MQLTLMLDFDWLTICLQEGEIPPLLITTPPRMVYFSTIAPALLEICVETVRYAFLLLPLTPRFWLAIYSI